MLLKMHMKVPKWEPRFQSLVKLNFDVLIRPNLSMAAALRRNEISEVLFSHFSLLLPFERLQRQVSVALLALKLFALHLSFVLFEEDSNQL